MKIKTVLAFVLTLLGTNAHAGVDVVSTLGVRLGAHHTIQCSTGLTCVSSAGALRVSSSPSIGASSLTLENAESIGNSVNGIVFVKSDAGDLKLQVQAKSDGYLTIESAAGLGSAGNVWQFKATSSGKAFVLSNDASGSQVAKLTVATNGHVTGPGTGYMVGFLRKQTSVASGTTTAGITDCGGVFKVTSAAVIQLPAASGIGGCRITVVNAVPAGLYAVDVRPNAADQIVGLTTSGSWALRNSTLGNSIVLEATASTQWSPVGSAYGTWSQVP